MNGFRLAMVVALVNSSLLAGANTVPGEDEQPSWGNSGALPEPQADRGAANCDSEPRGCRWWWPKAPVANGDRAVWGNRGVVFHCVEEFSLQPVADLPAPIPPKKQVLVTSKPVFGHVLFDLNKAALGSAGKAVVDELIAALKEFPDVRVVVEGHACDLGTTAFNLQLGTRRAEVVVRYMVEHGVDRARISAKSLGDTEPAVPNDTEADRKLNRRVQFDANFPFVCTLETVDE
ncbi:MAG: OmpA family protein [Candidatus Hydrogenedentes bacterium]|nr:OmpA family protein [Candidatus Hydrogenedentota bacterium]